MLPATGLSIVLPCFNPHKDWLANIENNFSILKKLTGSVELIIVNDGSTLHFDEQAVKTLLTRYSDIQFINYPINKGKGYALREGVRNSKGDLVIYTDIDFPYTNESFENILTALQKGADVAIGIRNEDYYTHLPKTRILISKFLRIIIKMFLRIPTTDTQCGLKGFNQKGKTIFLQTTINRYLFDLEFIFIAARKRLNLQTVEVVLKPGIQLSSMRWTILLQEFGNFLKIFVKSLF